jgi:hypothetical protein
MGDKESKPNSTASLVSDKVSSPYTGKKSTVMPLPPSTTGRIILPYSRKMHLYIYIYIILCRHS